MVVNIQFTALYGVHTDHHALSYLLTIDGFNILLDCGWTSAFDPQYLRNLAKVAPSVHVVLLSHPDIAHLGALPYAFANLGLTAPVFSTLPVWRMGQMFMYDAFLSMDAQSPFEVFNLDHVDAAFEITTQSETFPHYSLLKYQQQFPLDSLPNGQRVVITPHAAGHMLGGTIWNIKKDTESIVYAVDFNHRRERHLNPTTLATFSRPSHLIIGSARAQTTTETKKGVDLFGKVKAVVKKQGNVLIPVDTAGRVIELAVQLHDAWATDRDMSQVPLVILHDLSARTFEFARSMIEWMSDEVVKRFDISRENLFIFKHVKLSQTLKALDGLSSPMVVLASSLSMEMGFARQLFAKWCQDPRNAVMLVDRAEPGTLYHKLFTHYISLNQNPSGSARREAVGPLSLSLVIRRKEYLQGDELQRWREQERARVALEREEERKKKEEMRLAKEAEEQERGMLTSDVDETPAQLQDAISSAPEDNELKLQSSSKDILQDPEHYDNYVHAQLIRFGIVPAKPTVEVFSFVEPLRPSWDHYGQILDTTRFMVGEDPGEGAPTRSSDRVHGGDIQTEDTDNVEEEIPTKYVEEVLSLKVLCQIYYVDNAGLSDGDSLKRLVKEVEPRHVTLVAGTSEETAHFSQYLRSNLVGAISTPVRVDPGPSERQLAIVSPREMEIVEITSHTSVLEFMLQDSLVAGLDWNQVGMAGIAFVDATVDSDTADNGRLVLGKRTESIEATGDEMEIAIDMPGCEPSDVRGNQTFGHPTVYVGTVMLNRMKDLVIEAGMKAEYAGGALCVENPETGVVVLLKKVGTQQIVLEGALSEEYLNLQDLLYKELVIPQ